MSAERELGLDRFKEGRLGRCAFGAVKGLADPERQGVPTLRLNRLTGRLVVQVWGDCTRKPFRIASRVSA